MALSGILLADFSAFVNEASKASNATQQMTKNADDAAAKLSKLGDNFNLQQALNNPLGTAAGLLRDFGSMLGPVEIATIATTGAVVAFGSAAYKLATGAAEAIVAVADLKDKTGMSVPVLSQYANAAQVVGGNIHQVANVVAILEKGIGENTDAFQKGLSQMGLSTNDLKAAGPDRYLELVTAGLRGIPDASDRAAAGSAVLGRGYKDVIGVLNDLDEGLRLTRDITPFTEQQAADAKAFAQQIASLKLHVSAAATALGAELIPAVSATVDVLGRTGLALVHIADLGGLVSGAWHGLKLAAGEAALQEETFNAVAATTNRLFQEQGATAASVAEKMLTLGFSEKTVAEQTGLTAEAVRSLHGTMMASNDAAEENAHLWDRVDGKLAEGKPSIDAVSLSTRGLVADMMAAGVSVKDMAAATDLSVAQINLLTKAIKDAEAAHKAWQKAVAEVDDAMIGWQDTLDTVDGAVVEAVKVGLSAGASQAALATAYGLTAGQVKAISIALAEYATALANTADFEHAAAERQKEIIRERTKATNDAIIGKFNEQQAAEKADAAYLEGALKDAMAEDEKQRKIHETTGVVKQGAETVAGANEDAMRRSISAFENFKGVAVAGTHEIESAVFGMSEAFAAGGLELQMRLRDAQSQRGQFFQDVGGAPIAVQTRDSGGPVSAGTPYLIGGGIEPEIFVPGASGFVTPGGGRGGGGVQVSNVFHIVDTESNIARRVSAQITRSIMQAQKL